VGQVADLIVTDRDPVSTAAEQLRAMTITATLLAGRFTHDCL
jgi:predicted amidohydrolase YtcJ